MTSDIVKEQIDGMLRGNIERCKSLDEVLMDTALNIISISTTTVNC
jgi:hypothetical protein